MKKHTSVTSRTCEICKALCCRHIALSIDKPRTKKDYDFIRWYLMHENVNVFIDHDNDWLIEFKTLCKNLGKDHKCKDYHNRPAICREYPEKTHDCEFLSDTPAHKVIFRSSEEFEKYLLKKKKDWRYKK